MRNHTYRRGLSFLMAVCMALSMTNSFVYAQAREDLTGVTQQSATEETETSKDLPPAAVDNLDTLPKAEEAKDPPTPNSNHPADSEEPDVSEPPVCDCPVTDSGEVTHSADCPLYINPDEPAQEKKCTCTALCAEGATDETCPVCAEHWESCAFTEEQPEVKCTCTALCAEGATDATCPVCAEHWESCAFTEEQPEVKCTCTALCAEGAVDETCPVCAEHWENCAFVALEPSEAAKAAAELIAALPAAEAVQAEFEAYYTAEEPDAATIAARVEELRAAIFAARTAYDALAEEEKTAFDPAALEKLAALEGWLAAQPAPMALTAGTEIPLTADVQSLESGKTYVINDDAQWQNFSNLVVKDADKGETDVDIGVGYGATVKLNAHISGESIGGTTHLGGKIFFAGTFDGQGHTVALTLCDRSVAGLFTYVGGGAAIKNVRVTGKIENRGSGGGIVGEGVFTGSGASTISGCVNEANIICTGSYVGGIAGDAKYIKIENCVNTGDITGGYHVGGIAGVATLHLSGCYSSGKVAGTEFVGGIAGTVRNSGAMALGNSGLYALGETVTGDRNVGRVVGTFEVSSTLKNMYAREDLRMGAAGKEVVISGGTGVTDTGIHGKSLPVDGGSITALSLGTNWSYPDGGKFDYGCSLPLPSGMLGIDYPTLQGSRVVVPDYYEYLTLVPDKVTMVVGTTFNPILAYYHDIEVGFVDNSGWSTGSGNESIIRPDPMYTTCSIYAKAVGTDTLIATGKGDAAGKTATCTVTVVAAPTGVTLNNPTLSLKAGETGKLTATVQGTTYQAVTWSSSDEGIAAVDEEGNVTARVGGTATITAVSALDSTKKVTCEVTVTPRVSGVSLNKQALSIEKGGSSVLSAVVYPTGAKYTSITWSSSDPTVATVEESGTDVKVTAGSTLGTATITATVATEDATFTDTCLVTVTEACTCKPTSPAIKGLSSTKVELTIPVDAESFTYTIEPESGFNGVCPAHPDFERSISYSYSISTYSTHSNTAGGSLANDQLTVMQKGEVHIYITATASPSGKYTSQLFDFTVTKATPTEATPAIAIDYESELLTGFGAGGSYTVDGSTVTLDGTTLAIAEGYFGKTLSIVKKGDGTATGDSEAQSLPVPARPNVPAGLAGGEGEITGVSGMMEYRQSGTGVTEWTHVKADETAISGLAAGDYLVRVAAVAGVSFAGPAATVTVKAMPNIKITVTLDGVTKGGESLEDAVSRAGAEASAVKALTVVSGELTAADWTWFKTNFTALTDFTVNSGVTAADIPAGTLNATFFPKSIQRVDAAGVSAIGNFAFSGCSALASASFPDATSIGLSAFSGCTKLASISFPKVTSVGQSAFLNCGALTSASFPKAETIGNSAFYQCEVLASVSFPEAKMIGSEAFYGCKALASVDFPAAESIGNYAFKSCAALTSVSFPKANSIGKEAFRFCSKLTGAEFPEAKTIGEYAFYECDALASASFPKAETIGTYAFYYCYSMENATFPLATFIGEYAFSKCEALAAADFPEATTLGAFAFYHCYALKSASFPLVTEIPASAFRTNKILETVTFPQVTSIGDNAFKECYALATPSFPEATSIGSGAFYGCSALTSPNFPKATSIGDSAFYGCGKLKAPIFGDVTAIGKNAFQNCKVLTTANFPLVEAIKNYTFQGCDMLSTIDFAVATSIGSNAFEGCSSLKNASFPKAANISDHAFDGCNGLKSASFPKATSIGDSAFYSCRNLASASFPVAATIGGQTFRECMSLRTLTLGATPPAVGNVSTFEGCPAGRWLALVDANGAELTGDALTTAQTAYDGVTANGNVAGDSLWYGWTVKEPTTYTVTFDGDGATTPADPSSKTVVSPATTLDFLPKAPKKDGFVFGGWWTEKNGGGTQFTASTAVIGDLTVYAKWTALTPITIGETPQTATYNGKGWIFTVTPTPEGVDGFTVSYTKGGVTVSTPKDAGSYDVTVTRAADGTYAAFEKTITGGLVISPAVPTLEWPEKSQTIAVGGQITPPGVTLVGGETYNAETHGEIAYAYKPKTATVASFFRGLFSDGYTQGLPEAAGEYLVSAALAAKGNYAQAATAEDLTLTIEKASDDKITVTMDGTSASGANLEDAVTNSGNTAATVKTLTVTSGGLTAEDWAWFQGKFSALTDFTIAEGVTAANIPAGGENAPFFPTTIQRVNAPGVKAVGNRAFTKCLKLVSVSFPDTATLGETVFYDCSALTSASFPQVGKVGQNAFSGCGKLATVDFSAATIIDTGAFQNCKALAAPSFPAAKFIGQDAFNNCTGLTTPSFPAATAIYADAFHGCTKLTAPVFGEVTDIRASAFYGCSALTSASYLKVETVSGSAFYGCSALTSASFPSAITINDSAFNGCTKLETVNFPVAKEIGKNAFKGCQALAGAAFPKAITIGTGAFENCAALQTLSLGISAPTATAAAFTECPDARSLAFLGEDGRELADEALATARASYKGADDGDRSDNLWYGWKIDSSIPDPDAITIKVNGGEAVGGDDLAGAISACGVNPTDITTLEVVSGKITTADWNGPVFTSKGTMRLTALKDFSVAEAVKVADITGEAKFPPAIEHVDIPQAIAIHSSTHAFQECANLKTADIPHATELGGFAFDGCEQLTEANFPEAKTVGRAVFRDCVSLKTVTLAPDATFPDFTETFKNCKKLISIDCPNVETVDYQAFYGCSSLTAVSLPKLCHAIGVGAFSGCTALSRIELPAKPQSMDTSSFTGCPSPRVITFVDENGTALTGEALAAAQAAYKAVDDGDTSDDYWYGWTIGSVPTPGAGALTYPLTQDMVDDVFGPGNATLDTTTVPPTITINKDVVADETIVIKSPVDVVIDLGGNTITGKPGVSPVIRVEDGANVTIKGPGSVNGVDGADNPGGSGGNGGDGIQVDGSLTVDNGADINGGAGGNGATGGNGGDAITGSGNVTINDGSATGGDGGSGSNGNGGDGGDGAGSTSGKIDVGAGGSASGGNGGNSTGGNGTGGTGGNGTQTGAGGSTTVNGETTGGNGGSGSGAGNGGNGGNGTVIDGGMAGGNGSATGGNGGGVPEDGTGSPGQGGQGVSGGDAGNVTNKPGSTGVSGSVITIAVQPADQTVAANGSADFTVEATVSGDRTLIYQWYRMLGSKPNPSVDTPLTNAKTFTANDKNFTGIKETTYQFYCVLSSNGVESVTTRIATLTVSNASSGLTAPLTQEKVDNAFGPGNATLQPDGTIKIEKDVILDDPIRVETDVTIDLGGHSINGSNGQNGADGKPSFVVVGDHTLTIIGGGTISGGDGGENPGGAGGNGAPGVDLGTDGNISVDDGTITGGDGGSGSTGGDGGDGVTGGDGSNVEIGTNGNATGGNGGSGSTGAGGNGGDGTSTGGDTTVSGETAGGNGGSGSTSGGNGGNGSTSTGSGSIDVGTGGSASGGDGGSGTGNGDGGNGGNGTETGGSTTVGGNTTGGAGGMGSGTGNGGDGGDGTVIGGGTTAGGNGSATGGDGGNIPGDGTGNPGAAGDGISGGNAGNVTNTPGKAGYKVTAIVDDTKAGTTVTVPEKDLADAVVTQEDIDNNREVKVELIVEKKDDQPDKPFVEQILGETKADTIGVYFEITLEKTVTEGGTTQPAETITKSYQPIEITITIPADMRDGSNYVVIRVHDGSAEALPTTQSENKLIFQTDKFSTYAIAYTPGGATPPTPPSGGGSHGGSGGSSSDNDQYEFWMGVKDKVNGSRDGDVVKVNAHGYDKMPWSVMEALKQNSGVSLVITWNGKTITIPAGMAQKNESGRIYWPLSKLTELYAGIAENTVLNPAAETNPETGEPGKDIPVTGGVLYEVTAPAEKPVQPSIPGQAARLQPDVPEPVTPPDAGFQADAYVGTPDAKMAEQSANGTFLAIAAAVLMILAGYGVWTRKKKKS